MPESVARFVVLAQFALILVGLVLLWRLGLSASGRRAPRVLAEWEASPTDLFLFLWLAFCGGLLGPYLAGLWMKGQGFGDDFRLILGTAAFQLGMLAGVIGYRLTFGRRKPSAAQVTSPNPLLAGVVLFAVTLPVVLVVSLVWQGLLKLLNIPAPQQEAIDLLRNAGSPVLFGVLFISAVVVAPIAEELIFRAGIFRYLRTRAPRWVALLLPAVIFGALHANLASFAPLAALGVVFALGYERTGSISTSIVAHALFNLSATLVVLTGVNV